MKKGKYWHIYMADVMSGSAMISFHGKTYHVYLNSDGSLNERVRKLIETSYHMGATSEQKAEAAHTLCQFVTNALFREYLADRKSTRLNSSHVKNSYAVFCLKKKNLQIYF